jgi:hypothetical protein
MTRRESEGTAQGELKQQDSPAQTGQASSGAGIAGDPTLGSGGYAGPNGFVDLAQGLADFYVRLAQSQVSGPELPTGAKPVRVWDLL